MQAHTVVLLGIGAVLGLHTLAVVLDCLRCFRVMPLLQRHAWRLKSLRNLSALDEASLPPLTLLLPINDEVGQPIEIIRKMMSLPYPKIEYIVLHEYQNARAFLHLQEQLGLHPVPRFPVAELYAQPVKGIYQSEDNPQLWVIEVEAGTMAESLNTGLNFCQTPLVGVLSTEIQPSHEALIQATRPFLQQTHTWSVSGRIRPAGQGVPRQIPGSRWGQIYSLIVQRQELLDSVLDSQAGWFSELSEDLTLFKRTALVESGGFARSSAHFMADMAASLYRMAHLTGESMQLVYIPDTLGWYKAPEEVAEVKKALLRSQQRAFNLSRTGLYLPGRKRYPLRRVGLPLLYLACLAVGLPLLILKPLWIWVWLLAVLAPAVTWQMVLLLGERTDARYQLEDLKTLQLQAWKMVFGPLAKLSFWQIRSWFEHPLPAAKKVKPAEPSATSPLKL